MALIIRVNCSRKVSADYQSRGFSIDLQSEFDPRTLDDTNQLADSANHLFQLANDLLDEQVSKFESEGSKPRTPTTGDTRRQPQPRPQNGNGRRASGNGTSPRNTNGNGNGHGERGVTQAQVRAINNMAGRIGVDADTFCQDQFGANVQELTLKQGSELIDLLKNQIEGRKTAGAAR